MRCHFCGKIAALTSVRDFADRPPREMADGEALSLGEHEVRWLDTPHLPHGWECGYLIEERTRTLLCGDLFTQPGAKPAPLTESDILGPSEVLRSRLDYFSHTRNSRALMEKLAATRPEVLACMHGKRVARRRRRTFARVGRNPGTELSAEPGWDACACFGSSGLVSLGIFTKNARLCPR